MIEVTKKRRGGVKRAETNLASNQFLKCSPQPRTHTEVHRVKSRVERGREEIEVTWGRKKESRKGKEQSSQ